MSIDRGGCGDALMDPTPLLLLLVWGRDMPIPNIPVDRMGRSEAALLLWLSTAPDWDLGNEGGPIPAALLCPLLLLWRPEFPAWLHSSAALLPGCNSSGNGIGGGGACVVMLVCSERPCIKGELC